MLCEVYNSTVLSIADFKVFQVALEYFLLKSPFDSLNFIFDFNLIKMSIWMHAFIHQNKIHDVSLKNLIRFDEFQGLFLK